MPSAAKARRVSASSAGSLLTGGIWPCVEIALEASRPAGQPDQDGDRPLDLGRVAPDLAAGLVDRGRGAAATPSGRFPMSLYQLFQESAWAIVARSIRGPFEPIISGGPAGRGPRGRSSQSRAWYQRPSKSMAPSRRSVRMIVNASSNRSIRWSYGIAVGAELGLVPAGAEAEDEAAAAQLVDRGGLLGEQGRVVEVRAGDERPELDPRRRGGDRGQQRPRLPRPAGGPVLPAIEEVLADPHGVEPEVLDRAGHVEELGPADLALDLGELDADLERAAGGGGHRRSVAGGRGGRRARR